MMHKFLSIIIFLLGGLFGFIVNYSSIVSEDTIRERFYNPKAVLFVDRNRFAVKSSDGEDIDVTMNIIGVAHTDGMIGVIAPEGYYFYDGHVIQQYSINEQPYVYSSDRRIDLSFIKADLKKSGIPVQQLTTLTEKQKFLIQAIIEKNLPKIYTYALYDTEFIEADEVDPFIFSANGRYIWDRRGNYGITLIKRLIIKNKQLYIYGVGSLIKIDLSTKKVWMFFSQQLLGDEVDMSPEGVVNLQSLPVDETDTFFTIPNQYKADYTILKNINEFSETDRAIFLRLVNQYEGSRGREEHGL